MIQMSTCLHTNRALTRAPLWDHRSIVGGSYVNSRTVKGKAANVAFATDLLVSEPQVTDIYFANLNLGSQVDKLAAMLPTSTVNLTFTNGLLTTFPTGISKFTSLSKLYV